MVSKTRGKANTRLRYFYLNEKLHKVLHKSRAEDLLVAWDYHAGKRVAYNYTDVMRNKQHAYPISEVSHIMNKHEDTIKVHLYRHDLPFPQRIYSLNGNRTLGKYFWSEDDIRKMHEFFKTVHRGQPRKDGGITPAANLPSRAEIEARMKQETVLYIKNNEGDFVPVWKQPEW
jgi:hypothetical protein